jgi:hypothetical protein
MITFPVTGEAFVYLQYSGNTGMDTATSIPSPVLNPKWNTYLHFTAGTSDLIIGKNIIGGTSGATANVKEIVITNGTLAGSDAAGIIFIDNITGTWALGENITISGPSTIGVARSVVLYVPMTPAKTVFLQCETNSVRLCWTGYTPTNSVATPASQGIVFEPTENVEITGWNNISNLKFINAVSTSNATLNIIVGY